MGVAAARAKQVAEQLLGSRGAKDEAKHRAENLVDEGRRAAADVVSALRKEASVLFRDLEHLEEHLRGAKSSATAPTGNGQAPGDEPVGRPRPATTAKAAAKKTTAAKATGARRAAVGRQGSRGRQRRANGEDGRTQERSGRKDDRRRQKGGGGQGPRRP